MTSPSSTPASPPRFYLEELSEEKHLAAVHEMWSNPANLECSNFPPQTDIEKNRAWLRKRSRAAHPDIENFAILVPPTSPLYELAGTIPLAATSPQAGTAEEEKDARPARMVGFVGVLRVSPPELGYLVARPLWGRGLATEAVAAMLARYWRAQPGAGAVEAYIDDGHAASKRVAAKAGFAEAPGRRVPAGGTLPNGEAVDVPVSVWTVSRPEE